MIEKIKMEKFEPKPGEKIEKISIPDDDVINWMKTLRKEGFSKEEIDTIMSHANVTYRKKLRPNFVEEELENQAGVHRRLLWLCWIDG